jgi:uncharacterized protein
MSDQATPRWLERRIRSALADTPVVFLNGARQTGKSTLAQALVKKKRGRYLTLDDPTVLRAALEDPLALVESAPSLLVLDEVQRAPGLFVAIKHSVDRNRRAGRFLLTGSADVLLLPHAAESLAGRMEVLTLEPFAQAERNQGRARFIDALFANRPLPLLDGTTALKQAVLTGGYPEVQTRRGAERRAAWFDAYVTTITQRDVREWSNISDLTALPRLLKLLAARSGGLSNIAELSRASAVPQVTLHRYLALLSMSFLYAPLPAWHANLSKRLIKAPKSYLNDSGLACALAGVDAATLEGSAAFGGLLETFVLGELRREASASSRGLRVSHFRSAGGSEVDFIVEANNGDCVAIEVKATRSLGAKALGGLKDLLTNVGERLRSAIVLYRGDELLPLGSKLWAVPFGA